MGFSRQESWSGLPFPSPGDLPDPGIEAGSPALQADSLPTELQGKTRLKGRVPQTSRHHVPTHVLLHDGRRTREQALEQWARRTGRTKDPGPRPRAMHTSSAPKLQAGLDTREPLACSHRPVCLPRRQREHGERATETPGRLLHPGAPPS